MDEVNRTLFIPLYGKAQVSQKKIILDDPMAEKIWNSVDFPIEGKSKSKWLAYNMAMRARVFDDWTRAALKREGDAVVIHIGCGLDSRCLRVGTACNRWVDCDFPEVIAVRERFFSATPNYSMAAMDARDGDAIRALPDGERAIVILEGLSMYLTNSQLRDMLKGLQEKYKRVTALMDVYTEFGARASKYKNPVNSVGVTQLYGVDDLGRLTEGTGLSVTGEYSFTPAHLVNELSGLDRGFFKLMFTGKMYGRIYRLLELSTRQSPAGAGKGAE